MLHMQEHTNIKLLDMKNKQMRITLQDFILANRRASRAEEIEKFGQQVHGRRMVHKSKKKYDRNAMKRAIIKGDDSSYCFKSFSLYYVFLFKKVNLRTRRNLCWGTKDTFFCAGREIFLLSGNKKGTERAAEEEKCLSGNKMGV